MSIYKSFRTSPKYLMLYHIKMIGVLLALNVVLYAYKSPDMQQVAIFLPILFLLSSTDVRLVMLASVVAVGGYLFLGGSLHWYLPLFIFACMPLQLTASALLHNASHGNIKPHWMGRIIGEFFGVIQMVGFADWVVLHVIHHANSDDPIKDPHPPLGRKFFPFLLDMRNSVTRVLIDNYFELWGENKQSIAAVKKMALSVRLDQMMKVTFWWLLLGPKAFAWFFVPSVVFKMFHYAWFNYATHIKDEEGYKVIDLDHGLYKLVNAITFGLYYHGTHHELPRAFNPKYAKRMRALSEEKAA